MDTSATPTEPSSEPSEVNGMEPGLKLRSYQQEMLEASLQRNVIVAMETGSGKTAVATYRILVELERTDAAKLVWFIAPGVALSEQQHQVLSQHLPGYLVKTLLGKDGVDKWRDQNLWYATLLNVRLVVGTPAVLADALGHGFVHISRLSLIVFDEAHHCIGKHPYNRIMSDFYHPAKSKGQAVPHILGLSASPIISTKSTSLQELERSLDALAITPKQHRIELDSYVNPPQVRVLGYAPAPSFAAHEIPYCAALQHALQTYDLSTDPYVLELRERIEDGDGRAVQSLEGVYMKNKTWCIEQLLAIQRKSDAIREQLGAFAAEWYVSECRKQIVEGSPTPSLVLADVVERERAHLSNILGSIAPADSDATYQYRQDASSTTPKLQLLLDELRHNHSSASTSRAVIFVEQRAVVMALGFLLRSMPELADAYSFGTYVGTSTSDKRNNTLTDLVDLKHQSQYLESFRGNGKANINVLVATSVLEEGIDVSACNLVICVDQSKNLVQYVRRRGRARQQNSKYIILVSDIHTSGEATRWAHLEQKMKNIYSDDERQLDLQSEEEKDIDRNRQYHVDSTGALLDLDNAKAHLYHFCQVSAGARNFVDVRPEFLPEKGGDRWTATVTLPPFVHSNLRSAESADRWSSTGGAIKDAAFEAYISLHKAGLVNDNLLPLVQDYGPDPGQAHIDQPSIVQVSERQSSWQILGRLAAASDTKWYLSVVTLFTEDGREVVGLTLYLPTSVDISQSIILYWNKTNKYEVRIERPDPVPLDAPESEIEGLQCTTERLLRSVYAARMKSTAAPLPFLLSSEEMQSAPSDLTDQMEKCHLLRGGHIPTDCGLVRVKGEMNRAYFLSGVERSDEQCGSDMAVLTAFPRRRDFLHEVHNHDQHAAYTAKQTIPLEKCTVDALPSKFSIFAAFFPSVLHRIDTSVLAVELQSSVIPGIPIQRALLVEAISSPSAQEPSDYNRLEFLGDCVLKFCTTFHVMAKHPTWPEAYLSLEKSRIVSNKMLAKSALSAGLDKYILTQPFTGAKWRPQYVDEVLSHDDRTREMSSKRIADVVEALIGAAFVDGGLSKAYDCICSFLSEEEWIPLTDCISLIAAESVQGKFLQLELLERLVGHSFKQPELLIEALTHASFPHAGAGSSYERLEFLGDAVLDLIMVPKLFAHHRKPRHWDLHRMRDALVNGDFLAYCCMQHFVAEDRFDVVSDRSQLGLQQSRREVYLHDFIRAGSQLTKAKRECLQQAGPYLDKITRALQSDSQYPWPDLVAFRPPKFFSDIIESVLGALFIDAAGDLSVCESFVEKLGIDLTMRRILDDRMETAYPKEQLGILADKNGVDYACSSHVDGDGLQVFDCTVKVGGEDMASASGLRSKDEAELRAATEAIAVMQKNSQGNGGRKRKLDLVMTDVGATLGATNDGHL